jgi:serine/threonine-protein kinase
MADVFLAVQAGPVGSGFSKLTVIKRLRRNLAEEPEFVSMLVDEARIAARLNHPNVVQTNEVGEVDQQYFIAMEYLDGQPFHRIQNRAAQNAKAGAEPLLTKEHQYLIVMDALAGLHHAHELADYDGTKLEIVHRDITPHNVFVTYDGQVKVVDFGVAKAVGRAAETRQGVIKGKVRYMAPEQALGQPVDRRTDVFAAGVMLWEAAVGRRMWKDMDDLEIVKAMLDNALPPSPREIDPSVPEAIDRICRKAVRTNPDERYADAETFRADIEQYLAESGKLVEVRRRLPRVIGELFADKRAEIKSIIESQLSLLSAKHATSSFRTVAVGPESVPGSGSGSGSAPSSVSHAHVSFGSLSRRGDNTAVSPTGTATLSGASSPSSASGASGASVASVSQTTTDASAAAGKRRRGAMLASVAVLLVTVGAFAAWRANASGRAGSAGSAMPATEASASGAARARASASAVASSDEATPAPSTVASKDPKGADSKAEPVSPPVAAQANAGHAAPPRGARAAATHAEPAPPSTAGARVDATGKQSSAPTPASPTPASPAPSPVAPAAAEPAPAAAPAVQPGFVDPKGVRATVRAHAAEAQACYDRAQMEKPDLKGSIAIAATVNASGDVVSAAITNATVHHPRLESCLLGAFRSWHFPAPAGGVNGPVSYNFKFD